MDKESLLPHKKNNGFKNMPITEAFFKHMCLNMGITLCFGIIHIILFSGLIWSMDQFDTLEYRIFPIVFYVGILGGICRQCHIYSDDLFIRALGYGPFTLVYNTMDAVVLIYCISIAIYMIVLGNITLFGPTTHNLYPPMIMFNPNLNSTISPV